MSGNTKISGTLSATTLDVNGSIYQRTGELLITSTGGVNKEGPFIASSGGDEISSDRKIQLGISDNSTVPVGINMFVTNNTFPPSYMNFRVNDADLVSMSGSSVLINGLIYTSGITATTISATTFNLAGSQIESAWSSYSVSWTSQSNPQPAIGNGTLTGYYKVIGKTAFVRVKLNWGTTTSGGTGDWRFSLPVNAASPDGIQFPCSILNDGLAWYTGIVNGAYTGAVDKSSILTTAYPSGALTANIPFTCGNLDSMQFNVSYETA